MPLRLSNTNTRKLFGTIIIAGFFLALFSAIYSYHDQNAHASTYSSSSTFTSSDSAFVLPAHTYYVAVTTTGGGGAGGGAYARGYDGITALTAGIASAAAGGGGGGGQNTATIVNGTNAMQNNRTLDVQVGAGGTGATIGNPGNNSCSSATAPGGGTSKVAWNGTDYAVANGGGGGTSAACNSNTGVGANNKQYYTGGGGGEGSPATTNGDAGGAGVHANWEGAQGGYGGLGPFGGTRAPVSGDCAQSSGCTYQGSDATCVGCGGGGAGATQFDANSGVSSRGGNGYRGEVTVNYSWFVSDVTFTSIVDNYDYTSGGKSVVISGTNFNQLVPSSVVVSFCGNNGAVTNVNTSANTITVTVPSGSTGNCNVVIYYTDSVYGFTDWSNASSPLVFTYIYDYVGISVSSASLTLGPISPSDNVRERSGYVTVTSTTNRPTGFRTTVKSTDTMLTCATQSTLSIPSMASAGSLSGTEWGWNYSDTSTGTMSTFRPASTSEVQIDSAATNTVQYVRFWAGASVERETAACNAYSQLVTFTIYGL